jgi:hypothetical protein
MSRDVLEQALIGLQVYQVLFLAVHDWVPLGKLNDVEAVRRADPLGRLIRVTLIQTVPYAIGLFFSVRSYGRMWPDWLDWYLWISYSLLFAGQLRAWWVPYLLRPEPVRAERYRQMFGNTHSFLPLRNGMVPNTAHLTLHVATLATLALLWMR